MGEVLYRNEQFENIAELKQQYLDSPNPIISMDTKKKEFIGDLRYCCFNSAMFSNCSLR